MSANLSPRLRDLVSQSVALLGDVLKGELGLREFQRIESLRLEMARLRGVSPERVEKVLIQQHRRLRALSPKQRLNVARAFTLMLELMNVCENAFRSHEIKKRTLALPDGRPDKVIYVLTAHPTEARSPQNIWIFHEILHILTAVFERSSMQLTESEAATLKHHLGVAWKLSVVRERKPKVRDEAEHIYSTLLRDESLRTILAAGRELAPIYIRSWVGGDKDGHPGVDEKVFLESLGLSRAGLIDFSRRRLREVRESLNRTPGHLCRSEMSLFETALRSVQKIQSGDAARVLRLKSAFRKLSDGYESEFGSLHPALLDLKGIFHAFPGWVVPLEFRESSDLLMASPTGKGLAIFRMLQALAKISKGGDPRWYVRGFIISMASEIDHLRAAANLTKKALGDIKLPIIPLFEQFGALDKGPEIARETLRDPDFRRALKKYWGSQLEFMLGYSDSSKESGVLQSRLKVAETMYALDRFCRAANVTPLFFQGSGGSTDRGGGSVQDQTAWWPSGALRNYKVTVQGEMVERSLANQEIARGQLERIVQAAGEWSHLKGRRLPHFLELDRFAARVADVYRQKISSADFLHMIETSTPYPFLDLLKMGSRPSKRSKTLTVSGLRAIPWILCWTQTRVLFPTWFGVGTAWKNSTPKERASLRHAYHKHPLFATYVRALGFTLAKVELPIWNLYLSRGGLSAEETKNFREQFENEFALTKTFLHGVTGNRRLIQDRPWLQESITLRSPMIHPLNLLQLIAMEKRDVSLLRLSVTGISSGMMTTG